VAAPANRRKFTLDEKVAIALIRATEIYKKESSSILREHGLSFAQYDVLRVLQFSQDGKTTLTDMSKRRLVSGANMTGVAKRLEKQGLIVRRNSPADERVKLIEITRKGWQVLENISKRKGKHRELFLRHLSVDDKRCLVSYLKALTNSNPENRQQAMKKARSTRPKAPIPGR
jgi:DNA-binding MarR family transcriptional regulator